MANQYSYKWYSYHLLISCRKCGDKIIFQSTKDKVECKSCGNTEEYSWKDALSFMKVEEIKKKETGSLQLLGRMDAKSSYEPVKNIDCFHCKTAIVIHPDDDLNDFECKNCKKILEFEEISNELVFYSFKKVDAQSTPPAMVAVRCVSCGAPLEADPTKTNYDCKFCSTQNVLPPSLRYKVVINDSFIGVKKIFYPKELAFTGRPEEVIKSLKQMV